MSSQVPFGLRQRDSKLVPDTSEAPTVRLLAEAFLASAGRLKSAASLANRKGLTTRRGGPWRDTTVGRVIRTVVQQPGMVPDDLRLRCTALLQQRSEPGGPPGRRPVHFLGATLFCSCGQKMRLFGQGPAGKFVCRDCRGSRVPVEDLERVFVESLSSVQVTAAEIQAAFSVNSRATELLSDLGETISVSEVWSALTSEERLLFVDVAMSRIVVDGDRITVVFGLETDSTTETMAFPDQMLPSSYDSAPPGNMATQQGNTSTRPTPIGSRPAERVHSSSPTPQANRPGGSRSNGDPTHAPASPAHEPKAYRIRTVAHMLGLPRSTTYDLIRTGALASVRTGASGKGVVLVPADAVTEFLERKKQRK